jgi:PAS domain S-box-containing protein
MSIVDLSTGLDVEDIETARQLAEDEDFSNLIVKCSLDGIVAADASGKYTVWNPAMERMTGLSKSQVVGHHWYELFPEFKGSPVEEAFHAALQGKTVDLPPFAFHPPGTSERIIHQRGSPIFNEQNEVVGVLVVVRDITQSKKAFDALQAENEELKSLIQH